MKTIARACLSNREFDYFFSEKGLSKLPGNCPNIIKKSNDRFMERSSATFYNGKYSVLNEFCCAEYLACYTLQNKSNKTCEP